MPDNNPLLELYATPKEGGNPLLGLYSQQGQQPQADLGDRPTAKGLVPQPQGPGAPGSHANPILIQRAEGQVAKPGQDIQPVDIPKDIAKTRESAVQAGAEMTGIADLRKLYSGETSLPETAAAMIPLVAGGPEAKGPMEGAKAVKNLLSPSSTTLGKEGALALRKATGEAARTTEQTRAALQPYEQSILSLPPENRLKLIGYMEGRSKGAAFPDLGEQETIKGAASKTPQGEIFTGPIHSDTFSQAAQQGKSAGLEHGFVTSSGRYVSRDEALDIVNRAGQPVSPSRVRTQGKLTAEQIGNVPKSDLQEFADQFRNEMDSRKERIKLQGIEAGVVEDYVTHFWADPNAAKSFMSSWMAKEGSGKSLKARTLPTVEEGIRAGLKPVTDNPVEIAMRYVTSMDKHLGLRAMLDSGEAAGTIQKFKEARDVPEGWVQLGGMGQGSYAPQDWARIWNNFVAKGVYANQDVGNAYQAFRNMSNLTTQTILSFSGYHAVTMAKEAIASDVVKGVGQVVGGLRRGEAGQVLRGGGTIGKSIVAPITKYQTGKKFRDVYLGRLENTPAADVFAEAGGRAVGKEHAFDYSFTPAGSFSSAWKRGWLKAEARQAPGTFTSAFKEAATKVWQAGGERNIAYKAGAKAMETAKQTTNIISRTMSTVMGPLFEKYIPMLKNGAVADEFVSWLELNPQASHEEQVAFMAKLIDSVDNRFGEMIQDNIMWHTTAKQVATVGMLSYSWNLGSFRLFAGGGKDILATAGKAFDPTSKSYSPNAAWIIAYPMAVATAAGIYQYLKTGKPPEKPADLIWPQTGGTAPGFGHKGTTPETAILPGYEKEPFGWWYNGANEAINKANPFLRMGYQAMFNTDWKGDPIHRPDPTVPEWLVDYLNYVVHSMVPITLGRIAQGEKPGSAMGLGEELTGIRPGPLYEQDPEGYRRGMTAMQTSKWIKKLDYDLRNGLISKEQHDAKVRAAREKQMKYGGPQQ